MFFFQEQFQMIIQKYTDDDAYVAKGHRQGLRFGVIWGILAAVVSALHGNPRLVRCVWDTGVLLSSILFLK
jgi:hypothetical protein